MKNLLLLLSFLFSFSQAQLLFKSDLDSESDECWKNRTTVGCGQFKNISKIPVTSLYNSNGNKAIKIDYIKNEESGGVELIINETHVFTKFHIYYNKNFDFGCGVKTHRIRSMNEAKGVNNYDIIVYTKASEENLCGINTMRSINIARNGGLWWGAAYYKFQPEIWYAIETEIQLNTPGKSDGVARLYINDSLVFSRTDLNIRDTMTAPINRVLFGGWYSNGCNNNPCPNPDSNSTTSYLMDSLSISKMRISGYDKEFFQSPKIIERVVIKTDTVIKKDSTYIKKTTDVEDFGQIHEVEFSSKKYYLIDIKNQDLKVIKK